VCVSDGKRDEPALLANLFCGATFFPAGRVGV
jgi:hypothetical protein